MQATHTDATVRRVVGYWRRTGLPRARRRRMAEELRERLSAAIADGRSIESVTGPDLARYAARTARAARRHPVAETVLWGVGALTIVPGLFALIFPLFGHDRVGFSLSTFTFMASVVAMVFGAQLVRALRHRLTQSQTAWAYTCLVLVYALGAMPLIIWGRGGDRFVAVAPGHAWTLLAVGLGCQAAISILTRLR